MNTKRDLAFGRLLAIANVLGKNVFEKDRIGISDKYLTKISRSPATAIEKIHKELMEYAHQFGPTEMILLDMFGEIMANLSTDDFTNEPLNPQYLQGYYSQQNDLNGVIGAEEAADMWGLSAGTVKNMCADGKVRAKKIGKTWVISKYQPNPKKSDTPNE